MKELAYVCKCRKISRQDIFAAVKKGAADIEDLAEYTGAAEDCSTCVNQVEACLQEALTAAKLVPKPEQGQRLLYFLLTAVLLFSFFCKGSQIRPNADFTDRRHIGRWVGSDRSGRRGELFLFASGFAYFAAGGRRFGGPRMSKKGALLYEIEYGRSSIQLDLIGVDSLYHERRRIKALIRFESSKKMRVCTFMNAVRPKEISRKSGCHTILLRKVSAKY